MIKNKILKIRQEIGPDVQLLVVSKGQPIDAIRAALDAGQRAFGENRVLEAEEKFGPLRAEYPDIELHMIGPLQTNKVVRAMALFDVIQTLDRPRLATKIAQESERLGLGVRLYIEINIGAEIQKTGLPSEQVADFLAQCRNEGALQIDGLMAIPPRGLDPLPYFQQMKLLQDELSLSLLSMGMSSDYQKAVNCGSTMVRVGKAVFEG